jgi:phage terminase Nu1 subunit (DNA packaging protein)
VKRQTFTTTEAASLTDVDPRSFTRWARERGIEPVRRMRIGRSTVTLWSLAALKQATRETAQLDTAKTAC